MLMAIPANAGSTVSALEGQTETLLSMLDEAILYVERASMSVLWMTNSCKRYSSELRPGAVLSEVDGLEMLRDHAGSGTDALRIKMKWEQAVDGNRNNVNIVDVAISSVNGEPGALWVKLSDAERNAHYVKSYLAHREELFSTSRSLTVGEMATTVAHELNQPIGTMMNIVSGVRSRLKKINHQDQDLFDALSLAEKQGQFASDILVRIRDFTQARKPRIDVCDVADLLVSTVDLLDWVFETQQVNVDLDISGEALLIEGDATLLQQVFVNLLRNAVESMVDSVPLDRQLKVLARIDNDYVSVDITDSGHGLSADVEARLFKPFESNKPTGMGVGLNICRSFIELHRGRFWLSNNPGQTGCTAHLRFPSIAES